MTDNLNDLLSIFITQMGARNYAKSTLTGYGRYLRQFVDYLRANNITDLRQVTRDTIAAYRIRLFEFRDKNGRPHTISTISINIRAVKRFFEYLEASNQILINPAEHLKEPKKEARLPRAVLTEDEALQILNMPNLSTMIGIRDRAILEIFYSTGIRLSELLNLTIYDCDLQGGFLRVKGKFSKDRMVPLGKHAIKFLKEYITRVRGRHTLNNATVRNLFVNQTGRPLASQSLHQQMRKYAKKAGIGKHVTSHVFRHTFATQLVRNGADIRVVQKMLGHSRLSVTQIYTHVAGVDVKKTHSDSHPREKDREGNDEMPDIQRYFTARET
jgi:integrase/recombinase XerD